MFILYDLIFLIFAILYLPVFVSRKKFHKGFIQRLGILPQIKLKRPIWVHAVSVGEAGIAGHLVGCLREGFAFAQFAFSTVTSTGNKIVRTFKKDGDFVFYLPLDLSLIVRKVILRLNPRLCIILETELWPNLISYLSKRQIPIIVVNARISDRSFKGYYRIRPLIKPILNKIALFCVQTETDAKRLKALGVAADKIKVAGNMKYDFIPPEAGKENCTDYRLRLGLKSEEKLLVVGSTHQGEEEIILDVYKKLLDEFSHLRLLIAPRHPQRAKEIEKIAAKFRFQTIFISTLHRKPKTLPTGRQGENRKPIFILDTIGQLLGFYKISDIVFVGGSLIKRGGHNILEPARLGKPVIFGPHMFNFRSIAEQFLEKDAGFLVHNQKELRDIIFHILNNPSMVRETTQRAIQLIKENQGATKKTIQWIRYIYGRDTTKQKGRG